jgi:hypothetical protein
MMGWTPEDDEQERRELEEQAAKLQGMADAVGLPMEHHILETEDDLRRAQETMRQPGVFTVYQVSKAILRNGWRGGRQVGLQIAKIPEEAHGNVVLTFQGWDDDPRELFEIPKVVRFCRGILLGNPKRPNREHAKRVLRVLMDEGAGSFDAEGRVVNPRRLAASGQCWLVGQAFHEEVYFRHPSAPSGFLRDWDRVTMLRDWLLHDIPLEMQGGQFGTGKTTGEA